MDKVADLRQRLEEMIGSGVFANGGRLPPERRLAAIMEAPRGSLRKALSLLEAESKIWRHVGRGTFVGPRPTLEDENLVLLCQCSNPSELIEARLLVEPGLAALAATRATSAQISKIIKIAHKCAVARDMEAYETWDESFHRSIAEASGSVLLRSLFNGLNTLRKDIVWGRLKELALRRERRKFYADQHGEIVAAIANRDPEAARQAMWRHLKALEAIYANLEHASLGEDVTVEF